MQIPKLPKPKLDIPLSSVLAENLAMYRQMRGLTQESLSYKSGLHRSAVNYIELRKRNVTLETLEALAAALEVAPSKLIESEQLTQKFPAP